MGGKGSGRPKGPEKESIRVTYQHENKRHHFSIYIPVDDLDIIEEYCQEHEIHLRTYAKWLIEKSIRGRWPHLYDMHILKAIWHAYRMSMGKEMSAFLWSVIRHELEKDADFQKFKKEYQEVI